MAFCISIGKVNKNIFFPIITGILKFIFKIILPYSKLTEYPLLLSICSSLGMFLSFFLFLIYKWRIRNILNKKKDNKNSFHDKNKKTLDIELEYNNRYEELTYHKFIFILLTTVLDFILTILTYSFCLNLKLNLWIFDLLFISIFSHLIFRIKLYRHQYLCLIIIILTGVLLNVYLRFYHKDEDNNLLEIIIKYFCEIIFSLIMVLNKYTMEKKFASPYEICFFQGTINLILYIICLLIFTDLGKLYKYWNEVDIKEIALFLILMFLQFIFNLYILFTLKHFTACHILIVLVISEFEPFFIDLLNNNLGAIIFIIGFSFIFVVLLIFNEIIELNCCEFQKNTKKNITQRAEIEVEMTIQEFDEQNQNDVDSIYESRNDSIECNKNNKEENND